VNWVWQFEAEALRELRQLDFAAQARIVRFLDTRIATAFDPRRFGKPMRGDKHGLWRYRVGDHRLVAQIQAGVLVVLVVRVGHRKDIYDF
jgi:mRNA interferase RelE/StbE